ncbi:glycoside hydrolase family 28 protein [Atractiella rhizophila]|nr:glycoside hydrolase family 28 protein [Atractiella rhizophila]
MSSSKAPPPRPEEHESSPLLPGPGPSKGPSESAGESRKAKLIRYAKYGAIPLLVLLIILTQTDLLYYREPDYPVTCVVYSPGKGVDAAPKLVEAVERCGKGARIVLPDERYYINQRMTWHLENATVDIYGTLEFSDDLDYWIHNSYRLPFQNQSIAWHVTGNDFVIDGHGKGGIDGNGQAWYTWNRGASNKFGRPMSLSYTNATRASLVNFSIVQPQFWATIIWMSEKIVFKNIYVNATNFDEEAIRNRWNWVVNTDGSDTYQSRDVLYEDFVYEGGDDCISFKANSTNVVLKNITCIGGPGIAFGSVGQYPGIVDIIDDIVIEDVYMKPSRDVPLFNGVYFKSWIGEWRGDPPNGGGGGTGWSRNVTVKNVRIEGAERPIWLTSTNHYLGAISPNTSTYAWNDIHFSNISGWGTSDSVVKLECSSKAPCKDWSFEDIDLKGKNDADGDWRCSNFLDYQGAEKCHG